MSAVLEAQEPTARYLEAAQPALVRQFDLLGSAPGGISRLRELILTLAVQGKLAPQLPGEEPASLLLRQIESAKERLIAAGAMKRPKIKDQIAEDELPFPTPPGWRWVRLGTLLQKIGAGSTPLGGKEVYVPSGVKFLRSQNVWNEGLRLDGVAYISPATHAKMAGTVVTANDLLFNITGASIGRCAAVPADFDEANVSQHVTIIRPVLPALNPFLHTVLISRLVQQAVMDVQVGVSREGLSIAKLGNFLVPIPPLQEQARIVARVADLMRLCDALEAKGRLEAEQHARLLGTLLGTLTDSSTPEELAANWLRVADHFDLLLDRPEAVDSLEQTVLQLAVRGKLVTQDPKDEPGSVLLKRIRAERDRLTATGKTKRDKTSLELFDHDPPFALPVGWVWAPLQHLGFTQTGSTPNAKTAEYFGTHIPFIKPGDIYPSHVDYENEGLSAAGLEACARQAPAGSSLMVCIGTIGKCAVIDRNCSFNQQINSITPILVLPAYIGWCLRSPYFQSESRARSSSTTIAILNKGKWESIPVPVPPLAEQQRIVARVEELRRLCGELRRNLATSQATQSHLAAALVAEVA